MMFRGKLFLSAVAAAAPSFGISRRMGCGNESEGANAMVAGAVFCGAAAAVTHKVTVTNEYEHTLQHGASSGVLTAHTDSEGGDHLAVVGAVGEAQAGVKVQHFFEAISFSTSCVGNNLIHA